MSYGLYLSASGVLVNLYRQDVFANNLANASTHGFKVDTPMVRQRPPEVVEGGFFPGDSNALLDRLGGGVFAGPQRVRFTPGQPVPGGALDVYLKEANQFLVVGSPTDPASHRLTRQGSFNLDEEGRLVTSNDGTPVLDAAGNAIFAGEATSLEISAKGELWGDGAAIARLRIVAVDDLDALVKEGASRFRVEGEFDRVARVIESPAVTPRFVESSGTNAIDSMMQMISATKAVTASGNLIRYHDQLMDRAVNTLGRVTT